MNVIEAYGNVLKKYRTAAKLSQEQLALKCDLDRTYIGMLERHQRQPTITTIFSIADNLNISASDFIKEVEKIVDNETTS